ncbi:hypothetical protein [Nonomuraea sp. NPDC050202]|uniref:hypothetical protein n=1 Tax=Nonomuraea sp. NPDC050202 TaxID=3155035 RepID=UPI0033C77CBF
MRISASASLLAAALIACAPAGPAAAEVPDTAPSAADPDRVCVTVPVQALAQAFTNFFTSGSTAGAALASAAASLVSPVPPVSPAATAGAVTPGSAASTPAQAAAAPPSQLFGLELPRQVRVLEAASC